MIENGVNTKLSHVHIHVPVNRKKCSVLRLSTRYDNYVFVMSSVRTLSLTVATTLPRVGYLVNDKYVI